MFQLHHKAFTQLQMDRFIPRLFSACAAILGLLLTAGAVLCTVQPTGRVHWYAMLWSWLYASWLISVCVAVLVGLFHFLLIIRALCFVVWLRLFPFSVELLSESPYYYLQQSIGLMDSRLQYNIQGCRLHPVILEDLMPVLEQSPICFSLASSLHALGYLRALVVSHSDRLITLRNFGRIII